MASNSPSDAHADRTATPPGTEPVTNISPTMSTELKSPPMPAKNDDHQQAVSPENNQVSQISADPEKDNTHKTPTQRYKLGNYVYLNLVPAGAQLSVNKSLLNFNSDFLDCEGDDTEAAEHMMFDILADYLQPDTKLSAADAAERLDAIFPGNQPDAFEDQDKIDTVTLILLQTFGTMIWEFAKQIPHDHESQDKIMQILDALNHVPHTHIWRGKPLWDSKFENWEDPSRWAIGDTVPRLNNPQENMTPQQVCEAYINVYAFQARALALWWPKYDLIFNGLNDPLRSDEAMGHGYDGYYSYLPAHVAAAAQWILHGGTWLWEKIRWGKDQVILKNHRTLILSPQMWVAWMQAYSILTINSKDKNIQFWAGELVKKMKEIMEEHGRTLDEMKNWDPQTQTIHDKLFREEPGLMQLYKH